MQSYQRQFEKKNKKGDGNQTAQLYYRNKLVQYKVEIDSILFLLAQGQEREGEIFKGLMEMMDEPKFVNALNYELVNDTIFHDIIDQIKGIVQPRLDDVIFEEDDSVEKKIKKT